MTEGYEKKNEGEVLLELIEDAKAGDAGAFDVLYKKYYSLLYRYVYMRTKDRNDAEDLTQNIFVKIWKAIPNFRSGGEPMAYLYKIAKNTIIDHWRKISHKEIVSDDIIVLLAEEISAAEKDGEEAYKELISLFDNLSPLEKEILLFIYVEDLSYAEIAKMTGKNEAAIRQIKSRAVKSLREEYEKLYGKI